MTAARAEGRLPRWAQVELSNLRERVARLEEELAAEPGGTLVTLKGYATSPDRALRDDAAVRFALPGIDSGETIRRNERWIEVSLVGSFVRVRGDGTGRELVVVPEASNSLRVSSIDTEELR